MAIKHEEPLQPINHLSQTRRSALKKMLVGTGVAAGAATLPDRWTKPLVGRVLVPAHAQTSCTTDTITASSLEPPNNFERYVIIVDSSGNRIADFNTISGIATASGLDPGSYRVLGDSADEESHTITVETDCSSETFTVQTTQNDCKTLVATVSIPDGTITPGNGQVISGDWTCPD